MSKRQNRTIGKKTSEKNGNFFVSLLYGALCVVVMWLATTAIFSAILLKNDNSATLANVLSRCIPAISLFAMGIVCAKIDKDNAFFSSLLLAFFSLALAFGISRICISLNSSHGLLKFLDISLFFIPPIVGVRICTRKKKSVRSRKHNKM